MGYESLHIMKLLSVKCLQVDDVQWTLVIVIPEYR